MRISTHPNWLKRQKGLREERQTAIDVQAAHVGQAVDVLSDPNLRRWYNREMRVRDNRSLGLLKILRSIEFPAVSVLVMELCDRSINPINLFPCDLAVISSFSPNFELDWCKCP